MPPNSGFCLQLTLEVYEGEDEIASANTVLDSFNLTGLPKLPCGEVDVLVKFRVEFDGTLTVTAQDRSQGYAFQASVIQNFVYLDLKV